METRWPTNYPSVLYYIFRYDSFCNKQSFGHEDPIYIGLKFDCNALHPKEINNPLNIYLFVFFNKIIIELRYNFTGLFGKLLKAADKFLEKFNIRRLKFGTIIEFLDKLEMNKSKTAMAKVMITIKV